VNTEREAIEAVRAQAAQMAALLERVIVKSHAEAYELAAAKMKVAKLKTAADQVAARLDARVARTATQKQVARLDALAWLQQIEAMIAKSAATIEHNAATIDEQNKILRNVRQHLS
jgi:hypothetical protein